MNKISYRIYLFLILFSPMAFGTDESWSLLIMETGCFLSAFFYFSGQWKNRTPLYKTPGFTLLLLFLIYLGLQLFPFPFSVLKIIAPATHNVYQNTLGISDSTSGMPISIHPNATLGEFFRYAAYTSFYLLTVQFLTEGQVLKKTVRFIYFVAIFIAYFAIMQNLMGNGKIFWFREPTSDIGFTGPFFYHNHFASFMGMMAPLCLALFFYNLPRPDGIKGIGKKLSFFLNDRHFNSHLLYGFSFIIILYSLFTSLSRGGIIASIAAMLIIGTFLFIRSKKTLNSLIILALAAGATLLIGAYGWEEVASKFDKAVDAEGNISDFRLFFWRDSWPIIKDFPVFGTGFGSFGYIFPTYRTIIRKFFVYHAHSDYIETMINGGLIVVGIIASFLAIVLFRTSKAIKTRRDGYSIYLYYGCLTGILTILLHSLIDFNFQNGANGLYFFLLIGVVVSVSHTRVRKGHGSRLPILKSKILTRSMIGLTPFFFTGTLLYHGGSMMAKNIYAPIGSPFILSSENSKDELQEASLMAKEAALFDPYSGFYQFAGGYADQLLGQQEKARNQFLQAIKLNPTQSSYLQEFAYFLAGEKNFEHADAYYKAGIRHDVSEVERYRQYASFLYSIDNRQEVLSIVSSAMKLIPKEASNELGFLIDAEFRDEEIEKALPDEIIPHLLFARYLVKKEKYNFAERVYLKSISISPRDESDMQYVELYHLLIRRKKLGDAETLLKKALDELPDNSQLLALQEQLKNRLK
ncbi:MAG: hypothetical protein GY786_00105 [Proteobacteria bacterium]|nr:hypothetical protein [Pseudomonadota bacterium]